MSRHAQVKTRRTDATVLATLSRRLLCAAMFVGCAVAQAAQPLSDQELKNRYLAYSAQDNEVIVVVKQANAPATLTPLAAPMQLQSRTLRLIDVENTDNLLFWQNRQDFSVGSNLGLLDSSRQVLSGQPAASFGSEPFSSRWGGNLDQIIEISRISGFALYGVDVELYNISGGIRFETRTF